MPSPRRILVLGASGYVGGRLVPELVRHGAVHVRCLTRSPESFERIDWSGDVEVVQGDLLEPDTLHGAFDGVDQVVYLVHSLDEAGDFEDAERRSARNTRLAAERAGVRRVVYLSGLGQDDDLSPHLRSRHEVGRELAAGDVRVVELRAAIVLGAGSASFEMLRSLAEVLPVMIAPTWVSRTRVQPIAIADVLTYLIAALDAPDEGDRHRIVEIGGPDRLTYLELLQRYAEVAGLRRRLIVPVPVVTPRLSSHWVNLVTPLPRTLSRRLIDSLRHDVVVTDDSAARLSTHRPLDARTAIEVSIAAVDDLDIPTRWSGTSPRTRSARPRPWDPDWAGGTVYEDRREVATTASPDAVMRTVRGIGGRRGWYGFGPLWAIRGLADKLVGGVGLRRGRRHPDDIRVGEALDFWRVEAAEDDLFRLRAEMKLPGEAWLEWSAEHDPEAAGPNGATRVVQRARFAPVGVWGRLYWALVVPFHVAIFPTMLRRLVAVAESADAASAGSGVPA